jgi:cytochrome c553
VQLGFLCVLAIACLDAAAETDSTPSGIASTCETCHGTAGNSRIPEVPKLAGLHSSYLRAQLLAFQSGKRKSEVMSAIAVPLREHDIIELSNYYAGQLRTTGAADGSLTQKGERLYRGGDRDTGAPACMACHGPNGTGNPTAGIPALNGQQSAYVAAQLRAYRAGQRTTDAQAMMRSIAQKLNESDIEAVASYVAGLHE